MFESIALKLMVTGFIGICGAGLILEFMGAFCLVKSIYNGARKLAGWEKGD
jgi:hypothetical protein